MNTITGETIINAASAIGAGIAVCSGIGPGIGQGIAAGYGASAVGRNPGAKGDIMSWTGGSRDNRFVWSGCITSSDVR